jgi:membrane protease YdiL (CAAX protease family)
VVLPITAVLMWPIMRENVAAMRHWFRPPVSWCRLIAYCVMLGVLLSTLFWASITTGIAFGWLHNNDFPVVATAQFRISCPPPSVLTLAILVRAFLTPIFEEFIHRGFILHSLLPRGNVLAIILSALFFSVMHTPQTIIFAFLIGLLLAVMTLNLQTLWAPIIVHATFNLAAILDWACLHTIWNPVESTPSLSVIGSFALLTSLICVTSLIWLARRGKAGTQIAPRP